MKNNNSIGIIAYLLAIGFVFGAIINAMDGYLVIAFVSLGAALGFGEQGKCYYYNPQSK